MICGNCSAEQPFNSKSICIKCNFSVIQRSSNKGFWEGGEGQRDVTKMSRNDSHKYKGISKTVARKSNTTDGKKGEK